MLFFLGDASAGRWRAGLAQSARFARPPQHLRKVMQGRSPGLPNPALTHRADAPARLSGVTVSVLVACGESASCHTVNGDLTGFCRA
ncbi:hypothetical protein, partial [Paracoccus aminovorans]|uniref:hypothetical protein n=1 Tax=Paracoccus aminovorans TaxID=34004 RepID=UPI001B8BFBC3